MNFRYMKSKHAKSKYIMFALGKSEVKVESL
jgi:hypothetical protein